MRLLFFLLMVLLTGSFASNLFAQDGVPTDPKAPQERGVMTSREMVEILIGAADEATALPNQVLLKYKGIELQCIYDVTHDRMRIITPVAMAADITDDQFQKAMEANFHTALDARYAMNNGVLYAAFIHPLSPLTKEEIESALLQTATLAATFGKQYTSGFLTYRGGSKPL